MKITDDVRLLAKECVIDFFHDCEFLDVELAKNISLEKGTNNILIKKKHADIIATKTVKTVINDKKRCVGCFNISEFVAIVLNRDTGKRNIIFLVQPYSDEGFYPLTKDHILAKSRGGTDAYKNLQSMCSLCNYEKGDTVDYSKHNINLKDGEIVVDKVHYESLIRKQQDFSGLRKRIKRIINHMPWYGKLFKLDKLIERELKEPLVEKGYYSDGKPSKV